MDDQLQTLLGKIKELEGELLGEMHQNERQFHYQVDDRKVSFGAGIKAAHHKLRKKFSRYLLFNHR